MDFNLTEENELWRTTVHEFADKEIRPTAAEFDREARFNEAAFRKMSAIGLLGLNIPEALGGAGDGEARAGGAGPHRADRGIRSGRRGPDARRASGGRLGPERRQGLDHQR